MPEQQKNGCLDSRSDVFAARAVITEMISTIRNDKSRESVRNAIRDDPLQLPDHPLQVIGKGTRSAEYKHCESENGSTLSGSSNRSAI